MISRSYYTLLALAWLTLDSISGTGTALVAAAPSVETLKEKRSEPISFPIRRRTSSRLSKRSGSPEYLEAVRQHDLSRHDGLLARLEASQNGWNSEATKNRRAGWETLALSSYEGDSFYYVNVQVGTPPQSFDINIDTGSSDMWVQSTTCTGCNLSLVEPYYDNSKSSFDSTRSSTYQTSSSQVQIQYGDGSGIVGTISTDVVSLGQFNVPQQTFLLATQENSNFGVAGLIGLAWPALAQSRGTPWWLNALSQFAQPEMSVFLAEWNAPSSIDAAPGGQFTLGGRNTSLFTGAVGFVPLSSQDYWSIQLQSLVAHDSSSGNRTLSLNGSQYTNAIVDTGTTLIFGPANVIDSMFEGFSGAVRGETISQQLQGFWALPCSTTANVQFQFAGGVVVTLPATNLLFQDIGTLRPGYCAASFISSLTTGTSPRRAAPTASEPAWILGASFLKSTYTVFRKGNSSEQPSVGFAPLSGVNYQADGNAIIGASGDGVDGRIGIAGATVMGTGDGGGTGSGTAVQGGGQGTVTVTAPGGSQTGGAVPRPHFTLWTAAATVISIFTTFIVITGAS